VDASNFLLTVVKHEVAAVAATPPLLDQPANPSGRNECSLEKRKKSLHLLKNAKKQRKEEKAKNLADLCKKFEDNCSTDSEEEFNNVM
jgi:hypothetical protein